MNINLLPPSQTDELRCADGELDIAWTAGNDNSDNSSDSDKVASGEDNFPEPDPEILFALNPGDKLLGVHRPFGIEMPWNAIVARGNNQLAYINSANNRLSLPFAEFDTAAIRQLSCVGNFLIFLTNNGLRYALWNDSSGNYDWLGGIPGPPTLRLTTTPKHLYPYSSIDGEQPEMDISLAVPEGSESGVTAWLEGRLSPACPETVKSELRGKIALTVKGFVDDVARAGLFLGCVTFRAAWQTETYLWRPSECLSCDTTDTDLPRLIIAGAYCQNGQLSLRLRFSRVPYSVNAEITSAVPTGWGRVIDGATVVKGEEQTGLLTGTVSDVVTLRGEGRGFYIGSYKPEVDQKETLKEITPHIGSSEIPDRIDGFQDILVTMHNLKEGVAKNRTTVSHNRFPMLTRAETTVSGNALAAAAHSLQRTGVATDGASPLYAFCTDGIHALTPYAGGLADNRLISRDAIVAPETVTPLPDSVCFITERGVMRLKNGTVSCISKALTNSDRGRVFDAECRLAYHYRRNCLYLYRPGTEGIDVYDIDGDRWYNFGLSFEGHWSAWPSLIVKWGATRRKETEETLLDSVWTRPLKLGDPFAVKRLREVGILDPAMLTKEVGIFCSLNLKRWHFLGRLKPSEGVCSIRLRGSGWRFFKLKIDFTSNSGVTELNIFDKYKPLIMCMIEK